jgi:hypothetical protein
MDAERAEGMLVNERIAITPCISAWMRPKINPRLKVHHHIARSNVDDAYPAIGMHFHGVETLVELGNAELHHHCDSCPGWDNIASGPSSSLVVLGHDGLALVHVIIDVQRIFQSEWNPLLWRIFWKWFQRCTHPWIADDQKILISEFYRCDAEVTWGFIRAARVVAHQWWATPHFVGNGVTTFLAFTTLTHPTGSDGAELVTTAAIPHINRGCRRLMHLARLLVHLPYPTVAYGVVRCTTVSARGSQSIEHLLRP